jgi:hypothetical protein
MALTSDEVSAVISTIVGTAGGVKRGETEISTKGTGGGREMKTWISGFLFVAVHYRLRYPSSRRFHLFGDPRCANYLLQF